jgi:RNA polymerase sigma factor (sigma-70 family)
MEAIDSATDEELLTWSARRPEAFSAFYQRHENAMLVFFLRRTATPETAADLTAEVFAAALASASRFRAARGAPAAAWLYTIAHHKLSSSRRRGRVEDRARRRLAMEPLVLTDDALDRVEALADAGRSAQVIEQMLQRLPADQREALRLRIVDERSYDDIARDLSCSSAVVRQRVSRGLKTLRTELSKEPT